MDHKLFAKKLQNLKLLYIEDDLNIQAQIVEFLKRYMSHVFAASSAEKGLELYKKNTPDIILLDINLPGENGISLAKKIRQGDTHTRIVISTAYADKEFLLSAVELELTRYLVKPTTTKELVDALSKASDELYKKELKPVNLGKGYFYLPNKQIVMCNNQEIQLRRKELQLLEFFIKNTHRTLSYDLLQYEVWKEDPMSKDALRAQIRNLRKKIHKDVIKNYPAIGYKLFDGSEN